MDITLPPVVENYLSRSSLPYALRTDDLVVALLLALIVFFAFTMREHSTIFFRLNTFLPSGNHKADDHAHTSQTAWANVGLAAVTTVSITLCVLAYYSARGALATHADTMVMLLRAAVVTALFETIHMALRYIVAELIFGHRIAVEWIDSTFQTYVLTGPLFLLTATLAIVLPMNTISCTITLAIILFIAEIWLFLSSFRIFLRKKNAYVQLFIYLCTLEWMPLLVAIKVMTSKLA